MRPREYDILRTQSDGETACWLEATVDLETAKDRIEHLLSIHPGEYLVFSQKLQRVVMIVNDLGSLI